MLRWGGKEHAKVVAVPAMATARAWLAANPCACGAAWTILAHVSVPPRREGWALDRVDVACASCGRTRRVLFELDESSQEYRDELWEENEILVYEEGLVRNREWYAHLGRCVQNLLCPCGLALELIGPWTGPAHGALGVLRCPTCDYEERRLLLVA